MEVTDDKFNNAAKVKRSKELGLYKNLSPLQSVSFEYVARSRRISFYLLYQSRWE